MTVHHGMRTFYRDLIRGEHFGQSHANRVGSPIMRKMARGRSPTLCAWLRSPASLAKDLRRLNQSMSTRL